jgi:PAS domain S-box-containing protein
MAAPFDAALTPEGVEIVKNRLQTEIAEFLAQGDTSPRYKIQELQQPCKDGSMVWTEVVSNLYRNQKNGQIEVLGVTRDISERKRAEEEIRKIGQHYQALIEKAPDGIVLLNESGNIKFASPAAKKTFEMEAQEQVDGNPADYVHPEDVQMVLAELARLLADPSYIPTLQYRFRDNAGNWKWVESTFTNLLADESVKSIVINFRDITHRKQAEEGLQESEALYRAILKASPDAITISDLEGRYLIVSPSALALSGCTREEEMVGHHLHEFLAPEDRERGSSDFALMVQGVKTGANEYHGLRMDGSIIDIEVNGGSILDTEGQLIRMVFVIRDISKRKQAELALIESEKKFKRLVSDMQVGVLLQGAQAEIELSNPKALEFLGITEDQLLGKTSFDPDWNVIHEDGSAFPGPTHPVPQAIAMRKAVRDVIMGVYRPALGNRAWLKVDAEPQFHADGTVQQVVCSFIDITELKQAEENLRESNAYLENLINYANAPIIVWDPGFHITRFNHAFESLTGRSESEVLGQSLEILFPAEQAENSMALIRRTLAGERWETVEIIIQHRDKSERTVLWNSATLFAPDGITPLATIAQGQEITERKQAEEALRETNAYLENLINYANAPIIVWDPEFRITRFNHAFESMTGRSETEVLGQSLEILFPAEQAENAMALIRKTLAGERWETVEIIIQHRDKFERTVLWNSATLFAPDGITPLATIAQGQDITERKQAETALRESEEKFREMAELLPQIVFETDAHGILTYVNKQAYKFLGYPEDYPIVGLNTLDLYTPESRIKALENIGSRISGKLAGKGNEYVMKRRDGSTFPALIYSSPILKENKPVGLRGIIIDITERKKAEEKQRDSEQQYRLLVETANEGILVVQETYLKFVNPMVMEMTGYSSDELLTRPFIGIVHPDDRALVWDNYMTRIKGEEIPPRYHFRIVKKDTSIKWFELSGVKIDWEGKPAALNFVTDITERVRAEQEIRLKNDELQKLNTEKDKFFSIIAHDLRSPFNGFLGLTQLMAEELPAMTLDQIQKIAVNMRNSAANLFQLLENLLEWSRMEQGLIPFNPKPIPLLPVINESLLMVMESAKNKGIDISCTVPEGLTVFADRNMFQTIVRNLASNAVKFTARGGKIALKAKPVADNFVEIAIHDTGIGMDREMLSKLFRIDEHTSRKGTEDEPSTGLGLLMCSDFIERHGGKIQVESETDKGSIFRFTVPGVAEPVQKQIFVEATSANISTVQLKKIKVLIAEDDEASAMFISIIVKPFSIEQFKVTTGVEAVDALRNHPDIDLVLMDIKMPEMDGFEATRRIRQFNQKVVIIAQTAFGLAKDREMALGAGCNDHIPKPLNQNTLVELLQKYFFKD